MKIKSFSGLTAALLLAATTTSCSDDAVYEYTTSNECAITSVMLGGLNRTMHTKNSKGEDSTFTVSVTGAYYPMSIDQERRIIFNLDSLPVNTDVSKVVFTAINSLGTLSIRSLSSGQDTLFSIKDSTDFRTSRTFTVHATDGVSTRQYLMSINVHKQAGDTMVWSKVTNPPAALVQLKHTRSLAADKQIYVFGENNGISQVLTASAEDLRMGYAAQTAPVATQPAIAPLSVVRFKEQFYALSADQHVVVSTDGINWTDLNANFTASQLVVGGTQQLIALKDGKFYSSADGINWKEDAADDVRHLPETFATGTVNPSTVDKTFETLVVVGKKDGKNVVWSREIDLTGTETFPWIYIPETETSNFNIPNIEAISLNHYDNATLLSGITADHQLAPLYLSKDNGRTWKTTGVTTPDAKAKENVAVTVDEEKFVWMFCGETGEIWRGRINRLGWDVPQGAFE